jgi:hypothetical protein
MDFSKDTCVVQQRNPSRLDGCRRLRDGMVIGSKPVKSVRSVWIARLYAGTHTGFDCQMGKWMAKSLSNLHIEPVRASAAKKDLAHVDPEPVRAEANLRR